MSSTDNLVAGRKSRPLHTQPKTQIVRKPDVLAMTGLSQSTLRREVLAGRFPKPIQLSAHAVGWRLEEIERYLANRPTPASATPAVPKTDGVL